MATKKKTRQSKKLWLDKVQKERGTIQKRLGIPASVLKRAQEGKIQLSKKTIDRLRKYYVRTNAKQLYQAGLRKDESQAIARLNPKDVEKAIAKAEFIARSIAYEKDVANTYKKWDNSIKQYIREDRKEPLTFEQAVNQVKISMRKDESRTLTEYEKYPTAVKKIVIAAGYDITNPAVVSYLSKVMAELKTLKELKNFL